MEEVKGQVFMLMKKLMVIQRKKQNWEEKTILQDENDLVDKQFSDSHLIKSTYFDNAEEYNDSFDLNQDEHYSKIIVKMNKIEKLITIN